MLKVGGNNLLIGHRSREHTDILRKLVHIADDRFEDDGVLVGQIAFDNVRNHAGFGLRK